MFLQIKKKSQQKERKRSAATCEPNKRCAVNICFVFVSYQQRITFLAGRFVHLFVYTVQTEPYVQFVRCVVRRICTVRVFLSVCCRHRCSFVDFNGNKTAAVHTGRTKPCSKAVWPGPVLPGRAHSFMRTVRTCKLYVIPYSHIKLGYLATNTANNSNNNSHKHYQRIKSYNFTKAHSKHTRKCIL